MKKEVKYFLSFIRWRLLIVRYFTMVLNFKISYLFNKPFFYKSIEDVSKYGFTICPKMPENVMNNILEFYKEKIENVYRLGTSKLPFFDLLEEQDLVENNPLIKYAFSENVLNHVSDYYKGNFTLNAIQFLYSYPSGIELKESQYWHKDFGDSKSFHIITYLNDVFDDESGPFTFINKEESKKIKKSPFIRRIPDYKFDKESKGIFPRKFFGQKGSTLMVDPSVCYHYGSRGNKPRLAIFLTFASNIPFTPATSFTIRNASKLKELGREIRKDLNPSFFDHFIR